MVKVVQKQKPWGGQVLASRPHLHPGEGHLGLCPLPHSSAT